MSRAANRAPRARRNFYEIVLEGDPAQNRGILVGLLLGSGVDARLYFSQEQGVSCSLGEKLLGIVGHAAVHAIVDSPLRDLLKRHRKRLGAERGLSIVEEKRVRSAHFDFHYDVYARRYGQQIQSLLASVPDGVKVHGEKPKETVDESATGIEAYSPAHHYEIEGKGTVKGRIDLVIETRKRFDDHPLMHVGAIDLEHA